MNADGQEAIRHLLTHCGSLSAGEVCLVVFDRSTADLGADFVACAKALGSNASLVETQLVDRHGVEPSSEAVTRMPDADLIIGLTRMSMAHTRARLTATSGKSRYLSMPDYSPALLLDPSILVDYRAQYALTAHITTMLTAGRSVRVTSKAGTDIVVNINGRGGNCCPGFVDSDHRLGSPPDIETNVSPVESDSNGTIIVDGSVTCGEIGLVTTPIALTIDSGRITRIASAHARLAATFETVMARIGDDKAYVLAECGIGLNPAARLTGHMLTDEGTLGSVHFGFGSNATVGGYNDVPFHIDCVIREATLWIDQSAVLVGGVPVARAEHI